MLLRAVLRGDRRYPCPLRRHPLEVLTMARGNRGQSSAIELPERKTAVWASWVSRSGEPWRWRSPPDRRASAPSSISSALSQSDSVRTETATDTDPARRRRPRRSGRECSGDPASDQVAGRDGRKPYLSGEGMGCHSHRCRTPSHEREISFSGTAGPPRRPCRPDIARIRSSAPIWAGDAVGSDHVSRAQGPDRYPPCRRSGGRHRDLPMIPDLSNVSAKDSRQRGGSRRCVPGSSRAQQRSVSNAV